MIAPAMTLRPQRLLHLRRLLRGLTSVLLAVVLASPAAHAQTSPATAEALMRQSGLWEQLAGIAPQVREGLMQSLTQDGTAPSASEAERIARTVDVVYGAPRLRASGQAVIARTLLPRHLPALQRWFATPLGRKVTRLEEAAARDTSDPALAMQEGTDLLAGMPAPRRTLIEALVEASHAAQMMSDLSIDTALAALLGAASVSPGAPEVSIDELRESLEAQRPQMLRYHATLATTSSARVYASLPTDELARYVAFLQSEAGQHFNDVVVRALGAALVEASAELGRRLPGARDQANT